MKPGIVVSALSLVVLGLMPAIPAAFASEEADKQAVAALDTEYQAAVKRNDAETMGRILHEDFVLVVGTGKVYSRADLLEGARKKDTTYEHQEEEEGSQVVRVWGDTAVVTAKLWLKGMSGSVAFDKKLWFSDTYVRTKKGWRYAFGQASLSLPVEEKP